MKKFRYLILLVLITFTGSFLSACTGGAGIVNSWPGLVVDSTSETVYLAAGPHIFAVNLSNGTEKWRFPVKADSKISFFAPPTLTEDGQLIEGGYDHKLYSLNVGSGQQNWVFETASDKYVAPVLSVNGSIYAPNSDTFLYTLDTAGNLRWKFGSSHAIWSRALTDGKLIYLASMDHHVYAVTPDAGKQVWMSEDLGGAIVGAFALGPGGVLYVGSLGSKIVAINAENGKTLWQTPTKGWVWSTPVITPDSIIFSDLEGNVYSLDMSTGEVGWQIQPDTTANRAIASAPVVVQDTLYFASQAGVLHAVNLTSGSPLWQKTIGGKIYSDLVLIDKSILIAPTEFTAALVAVDLQGNVRWSYTPAK